MTDTSSFLPTYTEGLTPATPSFILLQDGTKLYRQPNEYNDITVNGVSISVNRTPGYSVEEVLIRPNGYGYVLILELPEKKYYMSDGHTKTTTEKYQFPGQYYRNNILTGIITII